MGMCVQCYNTSSLVSCSITTGNPSARVECVYADKGILYHSDVESLDLLATFLKPFIYLFSSLVT